MAHLQCFVDIQYNQKGESSQNMWIRCTMYTRGDFLLVFCADDVAYVRTKVENPVLGPKPVIVQIGTTSECSNI